MANEMVKFGESTGMMKYDPAAVAAAETAKQRIQAAYVMAYQNKRSQEDARVNILAHCKRPSFAEKVEYSKPVGAKKITGPSIRFTEMALREWRNVNTDTQVVYDDDMTRRVKVYITDLETNTTFAKEIQFSKTVERKSKVDREVLGERKNSYNETVYIVKATDDELANKESALISKAIRNEGLRVLPSDIVEEAMQTAKEVLANRDAKDPDSAKRRIIDGFAKFGVMPKDMEAYLGHSLTQLMPAEVQDLRSIYEAISTGEAKWIDFIKTEEGGDGNNEDAKNKSKEKIAKLKSKINGSTPAESKTQEGEQAPYETTEDMLIRVIKESGAPVTKDNIISYLREKRGMGVTMSLNDLKDKKPVLDEVIRKNPAGILKDTADFINP